MSGVRKLRNFRERTRNLQDNNRHLMVVKHHTNRCMSVNHNNNNNVTVNDSSDCSKTVNHDIIASLHHIMLPSVSSKCNWYQHVDSTLLVAYSLQMLFFWNHQLVLAFMFATFFWRFMDRLYAIWRNFLAWCCEWRKWKNTEEFLVIVGPACFLLCGTLCDTTWMVLAVRRKKEFCNT